MDRILEFSKNTGTLRAGLREAIIAYYTSLNIESTYFITSYVEPGYVE